MVGLNLLLEIFILKYIRRSQFSKFQFILRFQTRLVVLACHSIGYLGFSLGLIFDVVFKRCVAIVPKVTPCSRVILENLVVVKLVK